MPPAGGPPIGGPPVNRPGGPLGGLSGLAPAGAEDGAGGLAGAAGVADGRAVLWAGVPKPGTRAAACLPGPLPAAGVPKPPAEPVGAPGAGCPDPGVPLGPGLGPWRDNASFRAEMETGREGSSPALWAMPSKNLLLDSPTSSREIMPSPFASNWRMNPSMRCIRLSELSAKGGGPHEGPRLSWEWECPWPSPPGPRQSRKREPRSGGWLFAHSAGNSTAKPNRNGTKLLIAQTPRCRDGALPGRADPHQPRPRMWSPRRGTRATRPWQPHYSRVPDKRPGRQDAGLLLW